MSIKAKGICPYCSDSIIAKVIEENYIRRDKCICPSCNKVIYICRSPGCNNYAKGGDVWDDELCPSCTNDFPNKVTMIGGAVLTLTALANKKK
ncbi:hypothetical protein NYR60_07165 [Actinobacillus genomosp. 2]|uniref:hypothetical protein n=1 Tax=Actinobacillus genomosp. 2 TaxID=230709 RepID=UPI0024428B66|nr:hypothetical protein [Actinobacillus genomosp. 2]WGE31637.1 hypothetical protein NYR60_07165 [Actinobacillus genomosp. 2]